MDGQELNDVPTRVKITAKRSDGGQMIPKRELLDMLWGVVNEDPAAIALRTDAAKQKDKYWRSDEWIYIKDIEVSLKSINRAIMEKSVSLPVSIQDLIFSGLGEDQFSENKWVLQKINDCRENMKVISNPD